MNIYQTSEGTTNAPDQELQRQYIQLREIYRLAASSAQDAGVSQIAQRKEQFLIDAVNGKTRAVEMAEKRKTPLWQIDVMDIKDELSNMDQKGKLHRASPVHDRINNLPESAPKHYLRAVVNLKSYTGLNSWRHTIEELQKAIERDPENTAYHGLMDAISQKVDRFEVEQQRKADEQEKKRQERQKVSQQAAGLASQSETKQYNVNDFGLVKKIIIALIAFGILASLNSG